MKFEEFYWIQQNEGRLNDMEQQMFWALGFTLGDFNVPEIHIASYTPYLRIDVFEEGNSKTHSPYTYKITYKGTFQRR